MEQGGELQQSPVVSPGGGDMTGSLGEPGQLEFAGQQSERKRSRDRQGVPLKYSVEN